MSVKRRPKGRYNYKILERALRAEGKLRLLDDAHKRCITQRDFEIQSLKCELNWAVALITCMVRQHGGAFTIDSADIGRMESSGCIIEEQDGGRITLRCMDESEDKAAAAGSVTTANCITASDR